MTFLEKLVSQGVIERTQVREIENLVAKKFNGDTDAALISLGMQENELLKQKSVFFGIPVRKISLKNINSELLKFIPEESAEHYKILPIGLADSVLEIGMVNPDDGGAIDALQFLFSQKGVPFKIFLISLNDFKESFSAYKGTVTSFKSPMNKALSELDIDISEEAKDASVTDEGVMQDGTVQKLDGDEKKIVEEAPIIKIVAVLLRTAIEGNASDIHIENVGDKVKVRFRVDGTLHTSLTLPLNVFSGVVARIKILSKLRLDEKRKPQDGGFSATIEGRKIDFRVSTLPTYYGEKVAIRILDAEKGVKSLLDLGMSEAHLKMVRESISRPYGLILVTGPTGSGKTTTLYAMLNELNREEQNIISLEDPVEYHIPGVNQSQVMPEIGYTFASGLRSILRQDPNMIMVGEIRDKETAELAIQAALTGHLVFSTLHTNDAVGVVPRLVDMGIDPYLIAPTLILTIAQRLSRATCPSSRSKKLMEASVREQIEKEFSDLPEEFRKNIKIEKDMIDTIPSPECPQGTRGRLSVYEMFKVDKDMQDVILKKPIESEIYKAARKKGMLTMKEDAMLKAVAGIMPFAEVNNFNSENE